MPKVFVKPYLPVDNQLPVEQYPSYLPTDYQYVSLPPNPMSSYPNPNQLPLELEYDPWAAVAAKIQRRYPQEERPMPLLGTGGVERYQTWPERTIRSALTLPVEAFKGEVQTGPGLRREDVTDIPGQAQPLDPLMERAQDIAGVAGGTMFAGVPKGAATLGAGPVKKVGSPLAILIKDWKDKGVRNYVTESKNFTEGKNLPDTIKLHDLFVPKEQRKQGVGTQYMNDLINLADENNKRIVLSTASKEAGSTTSSNRLKNFYKRFGFVENKGHNKDFTISDNMYRNPNLLSETSKVGAPLSSLEKAPMFYSAVENAVKAAKQNVASKEQWLSYLKNQQGVKPEEMQWTGLDSLPEGKITKQQLEQHIAENKVQFNEVWKGFTSYDKVRLDELDKKLLSNGKLEGSEIKEYNDLTNRENFNKSGSGATKFNRPDLVLPGADNYRELLLQLPEKQLGNQYKPLSDIENVRYKELKDKITNLERREENVPNEWYDEFGALQERKTAQLNPEMVKRANQRANENFRSSHWDEPNVLAHIRMNDREIPNVGKSLHIEEIQSDWHQKGRKEGYARKLTNEELAKQLYEDYDRVGGGQTWEQLDPNTRADYLERVKGQSLNTPGVPDAPFKKNWDELAIKRVIRQAAEEGKDAISWTPGEAQASRYDLSKHVDYIHYDPKDGSLWAGKGINRVLNEENVKLNELEKYIGKETADKIVNNPTEKQGDVHVLSGEKLKVGGKGMKGFYDKMMVDKVNALAKKYGGGKVEQKEIETPIDKMKQVPFGEKGKGEKYNIHVLKLTPELKEAALNKGFALFSETSKVGAPLSALEKAGMTPEIKNRIVPAIKNYETGKIETVSRGKSHEELMMNYHQKSGGNPNAKYMDIVNNGLKNNETGYYDPKTKQFYNRDSVSDLESTELMTPAQLKKYEQNKVLWSSGLQFPKPIEQPSFNERWRERIPEDEFMQNKEIREYPTNRQAPGRHMENRPVRLTKMPDGFNPFE